MYVHGLGTLKDAQDDNTGDWLNPTWRVGCYLTAEAKPARTEAPPNALRFLKTDFGIIRSILSAHHRSEATRERGGESDGMNVSCVRVGTLRKSQDFTAEMQVQHNLIVLPISRKGT